MSGRPLRAGERFLLWGGERAEYLLAYAPGGSFSTHLGEVAVPDGLSFGDTLSSHKGKTFHVLIPSTADLAMKVHRTATIIYPKDAGLWLLECGIAAGSRVLECGTGSGGMTTTLARAVGDEGRVYSFERRPEFSDNAKKNLQRYGLADRVELVCADGALEGFGNIEVDAAVIDVAEPWSLVESVAKVLVPGGAWGSISPTIEQVFQTHEALKSGGFVRLRTVELLEREMLIRPGKSRPTQRAVTHTGYLTFGGMG